MAGDTLSVIILASISWDILLLFSAGIDGSFSTAWTTDRAIRSILSWSAVFDTSFIADMGSVPAISTALALMSLFTDGSTGMRN